MQKLLLTRGLLRSASIGLAIASTLGVSAASAHQFTGENRLTGPSSINHNDYTVTTSDILDIINRAQVNNNATVTANTGNNRINHNTTAGSIMGGDVSLTGGFVNDVNSNPLSSIGTGSSDSNVDVIGGNDTTGPNSSNTNRVNVNRTNRTTVTNDATLNNRINLNAYTGGNSATNNTTAGNVRSGSVSANIRMDNSANAGAASGLVVPTSGSSVTVDSQNGNTGPNSRNDTTVNVRENNTTTVRNTANVNNQLNVNANTGNNTANNNTTVGDVGSGDVNLDFTSTNTLN